MAEQNRTEQKSRVAFQDYPSVLFLMAFRFRNKYIRFKWGDVQQSEHKIQKPYPPPSAALCSSGSNFGGADVQSNKIELF